MVVAVLLTWFRQTRTEPPSVLDRSAPVSRSTNGGNPFRKARGVFDVVGSIAGGRTNLADHREGLLPGGQRTTGLPLAWVLRHTTGTDRNVLHALRDRGTHHAVSGRDVTPGTQHNQQHANRRAEQPAPSASAELK